MSYPNDNFASATVVTGDTGSITPFHYDGIGDPATSESGEDTYGIGETLWWQWTATTDGEISFTTSGSTSDDGDAGGLDTKMQIFTGDFSSHLARNDDGTDVVYDYNSRVGCPVTAGETYYIQVDQYGHGQAGTLHLSWNAVYRYPGPWLTPPAQTTGDTVYEETGGGVRNVYAIADGLVDDGATWAEVCEVDEANTEPHASVGYLGRDYSRNPPSYITYRRPGEPAPATPATPQPSDVMSVSQFPFTPDIDVQEAALANYSPTLPPDAVDIEYEGPTSFDPATWGVTVEARFVIHVNDPTAPGYLGVRTAAVEGIDDLAAAVPATVQIRAVTPYFTDPFAPGAHLSGTYLASQPLVWEQAVDGSADQTYDSGWLTLDAPDLASRWLFLTFKEQIDHVSPAPGTLPARQPAPGTGGDGADEYWYAAARWDGDTGHGTGFGDGDRRRIQLRFTWTSPRYRFIYNHPVTTTIPPLRQWPRDDGLRRNPGRTTATSRQGSLRRGPRGTYT